MALWDVAIVGGGPAGLSAALTVCARGYVPIVLSNRPSANPLFRAQVINNYPGMRGCSGTDILQTMRKEALEAGAELRVGHVLSVAPMGERFLIALGSELVEARRVILATGAYTPRLLEGEQERIGHGVSYCATCDGMLYRGKTAVVTGDAEDMAEDAALLARMGVQVTVVAPKRPPTLPQELLFYAAKACRIEDGDATALTFVADEQRLPCDAVFVLRQAYAADTIVSGLQMNGRFIAVDGEKRTNIHGLYAAGDCTGKPLQIAKAVGDGLVAAFTATEDLA